MPISVAELRSELSILEAEVRADPRLAKIEHLKALIALYGPQSKDAETRQTESLPSRETEAANRPEFVSRPRPLVQPDVSHAFHSKSKISRFREVAERELAHKPAIHRTELLRVMIDNGVMGTEKNPLGAFASNMYQLRDVFESDGKGNFRIRADKKGEAAPPTDGSLFNRPH